MNCSYKLSEQEVVGAMQLHGRGTNKTLAALSLVGVAFVLLGVFTEFKAIGFGGAIGGLIKGKGQGKGSGSRERV